MAPNRFMPLSGLKMPGNKGIASAGKVWYEHASRKIFFYNKKTYTISAT